MQTQRLRPTPSTTLARRSVTGLVQPIVEQWADEMVRRWQQGERPRAEEFLARSPDHANQPEAALELIAEELALREEYGNPATAEELAARFPQWRVQVAALIDCQQALGPHAVRPVFPMPGEQLGDFQLHSQLGRGAQGQVFLATQSALAARPVVLKLGPTGSAEHLCLARLQHSHIVPLYSVHEFPDRGLTGLCMPYFGGATLTHLLANAVESADRPITGVGLIALFRSDGPLPPESSTHGRAWSFLEHASVTEAVCWIGACLAEALQYAHDRGFLHLDLKPSNVLIAADGTPMLLDFHLARAPLVRGEPAPVRLGGTTGYMPPEQVAALKAVVEGGTLSANVDARADIFALGVVLEQCLQTLADKLGQSSVGLTDILTRCTALDADRRYPTAASVALDFRRHLSDLPLLGVRNRSVTERWQKWRRRRPYAVPLAMTLAALVLVCVGLVVRGGNQARRAEQALASGEQQLGEQRYREAVEVFRGGEALVDGVPFQGALRERLREGRASAERGQVASDLHALCEQIRPLYGVEGLPAERLRPVAAQCRSIWDQREAIRTQLAAHGNAVVEQTWQSDLLDLGILCAYLEVRAAVPAGVESARRQALDTLDRASELSGPSAVLYLERARHERDLGRNADADASLARADALPPRTAWEHLAVGRAALASGDLPRSIAALQRSLAIEPRSLWANYYLGSCRLRSSQAIEAVAAFSACVALAPDSSWCWYNRGLAYVKSGRTEAALCDFDHALAIDPQFAMAYLSRAAIHQQAGRTAEAEADLRHAADFGVVPAHR